MSQARPLGVTILSFLAFLLGLIYLLGAMGSFLVAGLPLDELEDVIGYLPEFIIENASLLFNTLGAVLLAFALISFLLAYGFFKGRTWAWSMGIILSIVSIIIYILNFLIYGDVSNLGSSIIGILIAVFIIAYLTRPGVKRYFKSGY